MGFHGSAKRDRRAKTSILQKFSPASNASFLLPLNPMFLVPCSFSPFRIKRQNGSLIVFIVTITSVITGGVPIIIIIIIMTDICRICLFLSLFLFLYFFFFHWILAMRASRTTARLCWGYLCFFLGLLLNCSTTLLSGVPSGHIGVICRKWILKNWWLTNVTRRKLKVSTDLIDIFPHLIHIGGMLLTHSK